MECHCPIFVCWSSAPAVRTVISMNAFSACTNITWHSFAKTRFSSDRLTLATALHAPGPRTTDSFLVHFNTLRGFDKQTVQHTAYRKFRPFHCHLLPSALVSHLRSTIPDVALSQSSPGGTVRLISAQLLPITYLDDAGSSGVVTIRSASLRKSGLRRWRYLSRCRLPKHSWVFRYGGHSWEELMTIDQ